MALIKVFKPTKFATLFSVYDPSYDALDEQGVKVEVKATTFSVLGPEGQNIVGNIGLNKGCVTLAASGDLPDIAKVPVGAAIKSSFNHALKPDNWSKVEPDPLPGQPLPEPEGMHGELFQGMTPIADGVDDIEAADDIEAEAAMEAAAFKDIDVVSLAKDDLAEEDHAILKGYEQKILKKHMADMAAAGLHKPKVKLVNADSLYQPVGSSSADSVYHCVGIATNGLKFAARRSEQSLSIRVEGPVQQHKAALIGAGYNEDYISKGYTSIHFHGIDDLMAQRALGAMISGVGATFVTPMPDIDQIAGKGT